MQESKTNPCAPGNADELHNFIGDLLALLEGKATLDEAQVTQLRKRVEAPLHGIRKSWVNGSHRVRELSKHAVKSTDDYAHESPWIVAGVVAAVGVAIGAVLARLRTA